MKLILLLLLAVAYGDSVTNSSVRSRHVLSCYSECWLKGHDKINPVQFHFNSWINGHNHRLCCIKQFFFPAGKTAVLKLESSHITNTFQTGYINFQNVLRITLYDGRGRLKRITQCDGNFHADEYRFNARGRRRRNNYLRLVVMHKGTVPLKAKVWLEGQFPEPNIVCGVRGGVPRIQGGLDAAPKEFPWQAGLVETKPYHPSPFCGGTLISHTHILTAAHCMYKKVGPPHATRLVLMHREEFKVALGGLFTTLRSLKVIKDYFNHEYYSPAFKIYDVAIVILRKPVGFSMNVIPACLPNQGDIGFETSDLTASGWGKLSFLHEQPTILQKITLRGMTNMECRILRGARQVPPSQLCAQVKTVGQGGVCKGDSGGPLTWNKNGKETVVGISSFLTGIGHPSQNCNGDVPNTFARVTHVIEWIKRIMKKSC